MIGMVKPCECDRGMNSSLPATVPDYQVFPITLPELRAKRNAGREIKMSLVLNGTKVDLKLTPSEGHLASKYTPVLSAISDDQAYNGIRYEALSNVSRQLVYSISKTHH